MSRLDARWIDSVGQAAGRVLVAQGDSTVGWGSSGDIDATGSSGRVGFTVDTWSDGKQTILGMISDLGEDEQITSAVNPSVSTLRFHIVLNITTLTVAGDIQVQGDTYDKTTGNVTVGDTETLSITSTGFYKTSKYWVGSIDLVGVGSTDVNADIHAYESHEIPFNYEVTSLHYYWLAEATTNSVTVTLDKYNFIDHTKVTMFSNTDTNIGDQDTPGHLDRTWGTGEVVFDQSSGDRMILSADTRKARDLVFEMRYRIIP